MITSLGFKTKARPQNYKKARYAIGNVSKKDLYKGIKEFEKIDKLPYEKKRIKHEPTDSYFHLAIQLEKCMMRSDNLNWNDHGDYTNMTAPSLNVNATDEDESEHIIMPKSLSDNRSTDVSKSKRNIVKKTLSKNNSANVPEYTITELKDKGYKEPSVTKEVKLYFNIFECGRNLLERLDVTYHRAFMATSLNKYYTEMLENQIKVNNLKSEPLSDERLQQVVIDVGE